MNRILNIFFYALLLNFCVSCKQSEKKLPFDYNEMKETFIEGDIVFRRGNSVISNTVIAADKCGKYSHCGIALYVDKEWKILHAVPGEPDAKGEEDCVKLESISIFFQRSRADIAAIKRIPLNKKQRNIIHIMGVNIYNNHTPFDHKFNDQDTSAYYCTELIQHIFNKIGIDLSENRCHIISLPFLKGSYVFPSDIAAYSKMKDVLYY